MEKSRNTPIVGLEACQDDRGRSGMTRTHDLFRLDGGAAL
jgi:hypothetical protein